MLRRVEPLLPYLSRCSTSAGRPWILSLALLSLLVLFLRFSTSGHEYTVPLPPRLKSSPAAEVLRPGQFVDPSRQRTVPDRGAEPHLNETDGAGTVHDTRNDKFYAGGIRTLTTRRGEGLPRQTVYDPYPDYNSKQWRKTWKGTYKACDGPRGKMLDRTRLDDMVSVYRGNQKEFPYPMLGSHEALNLDANVCTDRCSRWASYSDFEDQQAAGCSRTYKTLWDGVNWWNLQAQCAKRNKNRYKSLIDAPHKTLLKPTSATFVKDDKASDGQSSGPRLQPQTAVIIRTWHNMAWTPNHKQYLRSLIMELSLHTGAEYQVFLLVDVKEPINLKDSESIQAMLDHWIPAEFHDIVVLFNTEVLEQWYPQITEHEPKYQHLQPIQIFSRLHQNFDYVWQFEMDARNTGHAYHFLERLREFAKQQPRKYLWERNAYFYTPGAHGTWDDFTRMVDRSMIGRENASVWGPVPAEGIQPVGPRPPVGDPQLDHYKWGVGEEADLITLLPIFSAPDTKWTFPNLIWNVPEDLPRRASVITMWRMSRELLHVMHLTSEEGKAVVSEMSGPTWALLHGLKAVHAPHPIYVDGQWGAREFARMMNRGAPEKINGGPDSAWNWNHKLDHLFYRTSYMFTTQTAEDLIRRWLGFPADEKQHEDPDRHRDPYGRYWFDEGKLDEERYGHLCYPPMFVHTVKNTREEKDGGAAVPV